MFCLAANHRTALRYSFLAAMFLVVVPEQRAISAFPSLGDITAATVQNGTLVIGISGDQLKVQVCGPTILQIDYLRQGQIDPPTPVVDFPHSWPGDPAATIDVSADPIVVKSSRMRLEIARHPCRLTLFDDHANKLLWETAGGGMFVEDPGASSNARGGLRFSHNPSQHFYGAKAYGLDAYGGMPRPGIDDQFQILRDGRGIPDRTYLINAAKQGGAGAPGIWSSSGYGLLVDSDGGYLMVSDAQLEFYYGTPGEADNLRHYFRDHSLEFFLLVGSPKEMLTSIAQISGRAPMFPRWAMGFTNSQWGINQSEFYNILDGYRARDIPIDNFTFDFDWKAWGEDNFGEFRFNATKFPDALAPGPAGFGSALAANADQRAVKMTGIMKPRIIRSTIPNNDDHLTVQAQQAQSKGFFYPGVERHKEYLPPKLFVGELDFSKPACRTWFWQAMHDHQAIERGIAGYWNDEADSAADEDSGRQANFNNFEHFHMQQALYEGQRGDAPSPQATQRVWSLSRNFYLGAQRYAYGMWSGDIFSGFASMQQQSVRMLSAVALGEAKWGMDSGGFNGLNSNDENYARWIQFSSLVPVFRVHGNQDVKHYPWAFGFQAEETAKSAIRWRYGLAPYIYACERECLESGIGLVRPLVVEYPTDAGSAAVSDSWMVGQWLLAAPVLQEQHSTNDDDHGSLAQNVYLPPGQWIDYFRGDVLQGGAVVHYPTNAVVWSDVPIFIRMGAILLSQDVVPSLGKAHPSLIYLDAFPTPNETATTFYDDDGATYDYENGAFCKQRITAADQGQSTTLTVAAKEGPFQSSVQFFLVRLHGRAAAGVTLAGAAQSQQADLRQLKSNGHGWAIGRDIYGPVTYVMVPAGAGSPQTVVATGSQSINQDAEKFETEEASLAGASMTTRANVNANHHGFSGSGFVDHFENVDTRITFYINRKSPGTYDLTLRAANATGQAGTLSVFVNGVAQRIATIPAQSDWDTWTNVPLQLSLAAGNNIITLRQMPSDTGKVNLDLLSVPWWPTTEQYELESTTMLGDAKVNWNHGNFNGVGFIDKLESTGSGVDLNVDVPSDGTYTFSTRYSNGTGAAQTMSLYVNGTKIESATFAPTNNWDTWGTQNESITLHRGKSNVVFKCDAMDSGHINLDSIAIAP